MVVREDLAGKRFFYVTGLKGLTIYDIILPPRRPAGFPPGRETGT